MPSRAQLKYIIISIFLIAVSIGFLRSTFQMLQSKKRLDDLETEVSLLEQQKQDLQDSIEYKKSEEYIEERARNDLSLVKPGEQVFVATGLEEDAAVLGEKIKNPQKSPKYRDEVWYLWYKLFF